MSTEFSHISPRGADMSNIYDNVNTTDAAHLSNYVFANASDFLDVLGKVLPKIPAHSMTGVDQIDLDYYASTTKDPKERAAATMASEHYDQLLDMPNLKADMTGLPANALNAGDVKRTDDMVTGNSNWDKLEDKINMGITVFVTGSATLMVGTGAVVGGVTGDVPLAIGAGVLAAGMGLGTGKVALDLANYDSQFNAKSAQDRTEINGWIANQNKDK